MNIYNIHKMNKQTSNLNNDDIEVIDVENYSSDKFQIFNHQILVMEVLRKATEAGSHELRAGWFNEKIDPSGNIARTYVEDTRKRFIETVKTASAIMKCDYDDIAKANIDKSLDSLKKIKISLMDAQWKWFEVLPPRIKMEYTGRISKAFFNIDLGWYLKFIEEEVECYRNILEELHSLTKRLDFYQTADYEA